MRLRVPVFVLVAMAVASPGVRADNNKEKQKDKDKDRKEQKRDDRDDRDDRDGRDDHDRDGKVTICHVPPGNRSARHTITVGESAWAAHRNHGDERGPCRSGDPDQGFARYDRNNDGVLVRDEWPRDRASFERYDRDNDGRVTLREWRNPPGR